MIEYLGRSRGVSDKTTLEKGIPLLIEAATQYLSDNLSDHPSIFEWGSGGSTIWFARRGHVISMELDPVWYNLVRARLEAEHLHAMVVLHTDIELYKASILSAPKETFDLVLVDGRHRNSCITNAISRIKPGGYLCLDNSGRKYYNCGKRLLERWPGVEWGTNRWMTTIWRKP